MATVSPARAAHREKNKAFQARHGWAPNIAVFEREFDVLRGQWPWDLETLGLQEPISPEDTPLTWAYDPRFPIIDLDPCDTGHYGLVRDKNSVSHGQFPSSVWGAAGDNPWPNNNRRKRLAGMARNLRLLGLRELASAVVNIHRGRVPAGTTKAGVRHFLVTASQWLHYHPPVFAKVLATRKPFGPEEEVWIRQSLTRL